MKPASVPGLEWLQGYSNRWPVVPLRFVARMGTGHTPDRNKPGYWEKCHIPWVTTPDVTMRPDSTEPLMDTQQKISDIGLANSAAVLHPAGTVMLSRTASVGYSTVIGRPMATTQAFVTWTPGPSLDSRYLLFVLRAMSQEWDRLAYGSTHKTIYMPDLEALRIPLPPVEEQRRIAAFLDTHMQRIDKVRAARSRMKGLLQLRRARVVERLIGHEGDPTELVPLKHLVAAVTVGIVVTPAAWYVESGGVAALRGINIKPGRIDARDLVQISHEGHIANRKSRLRSGDLVVVRTGLAGAAAVVTDELDGANCIDLVIVRPGPALVPRFVEYLLNSGYAKRRVAEFSVGSIQSHFNVAAMKAMPVPRRSLTDQQRIVAEIDRAVEPIDGAVRRMEKQDQLLAERRQALIIAAVTGRSDVAGAREVEV